MGEFFPNTLIEQMDLALGDAESSEKATNGYIRPKSSVFAAICQIHWLALFTQSEADPFKCIQTGRLCPAPALFSGAAKCSFAQRKRNNRPRQRLDRAQT